MYRMTMGLQVVLSDLNKGDCLAEVAYLINSIPLTSVSRWWEILTVTLSNGFPCTLDV